MSKRLFDPKECIGPLNNIKSGLQMTERPFTKETIINSLKGCGLPTNSTFWSVFRNSGILQEVSRGKFMFTSKEPIYVGTLSSIRAKYRELARRYNNGNKESELQVSEKREEQESKVLENDLKTLTQDAINLLKEQGYRIFAPVATIYEEL